MPLRPFVALALSVLLIAGGCAPSAHPATSQPQAPIVRAALGQKIGELGIADKQRTMTLGNIGHSAIMRSISHGAHTDDPATTKSGKAFVGSGLSVADMIRPVQPVVYGISYPELLYGYLAHIDPGGKTMLVEFYEDSNGCETDLVTRRGRDGAKRIYVVDSTGWVDGMLSEMDSKPERHCTR